MEKFARIISAIFHPLLMLPYCVMFALYATELMFAYPIEKLLVVAISLTFMTIIPGVALWVLKRLRYITSYDIENRKERDIPYIVMIVCSAAGTILQSLMWAPSWFVGLHCGIIGALGAAYIFNGWWKVSLHGIGVGGMMGVVIAAAPYGITAMNLPFSIATLIAGLVCSSRITLGRHTLGQTLFGTALGAAGTVLGAWIYTHSL